MNYNLAGLPDEYRTARREDLERRILAQKQRLGQKLVILTHHYQRLEIVRFNDFLGDSYALAKSASYQKDAEVIVFCGVRFMAEAADILTGPDQKVYLANPTAGCPMADLAPTSEVQTAWDYLESALGNNKVIPLAYMNSAADLKAFCGRNDGLICTSSNAGAAFEHCLSAGKKLFFFPDQHLGRNTANAKKIPRDRVALYNPNLDQGGLSAAQIEKADVILWYGHCHVHMNFTADQVGEIRGKYPEAKVVVHPECKKEVVDAADATGSTSFIVKYAEQAPPGSVIAIGTELNLVYRLAVTYPDKKIISLAEDMCVVCSNMFRTSLQDLCFTLENLDKADLVVVPDDIAGHARVALQRMLKIGR